ncbi:MAG: PAS domain-containing protein [Desulfobacterales bacterium]|nr:PAS domain-containing protein [Desulfobacterales bacterium]
MRTMSPNDRRKARFLRVITAIGIPIALMFCALYAMLGQWRGVFFGLTILIILTAARLGMSRIGHSRTYMSGTGVLSIAFWLIIATGTGAPYNLFWIFILPLLYYIFLDLKPASRLLALNTIVLIILLLRPGFLNTHVYDIHLVLRFLISYALVSLMAWTYETTRKEYEAELARQTDELKKQKELMTTLLETLPNPIFFKDVRGIYLGCNQAFEEMMNMPRDQIIGKTVYGISPKELADVYYQKDKELFDSPGRQIYESDVQPPGGKRQHVICHKSTYTDETGKVRGLIGAISDITELRNTEAEKTKLIHELETALAEIKTLSGMLPICSSCKKIRDDKGYWNRLETYIEQHSGALFSHSICPACSKDLYGNQPWFNKLKDK